ncbi:arsenic resistance protein 2 isoform X4 [Tachypleus tridentatus]|uniref:arsenic resistance protein 2 isoform X4 n=1 Tax=Tachypleus tridentatus TaxID=6853 RepID=UPI003FD27FF9
MADSDDEYDRRRGRDKFRRERSDYQDRRDERNRRDEWSDRFVRESWPGRERARRDYRDGYDPRRRERYSPPPRHDMSPPMKRMRREWDDPRGYGGYGMGYPGGVGMMGGPPGGGWGGGMPPEDIGMMHGQHGYGGHPGPPRDEPGATQPPMMTFKQFLAAQDDNIGDQEAIKKYNEYKLDFKRQQINEFFISHKEEEWFKSKYHPEEWGKRRADQLSALKRRLDVFKELFQKGWVDAVSIDVEKSDQIIRLLDAVVIKLEGGSDNDLKVLDEPYEEEDKPKEPEPFILGDSDIKEEKEKEERDISKPLQMIISSEQKELQKKAKEYLKNKQKKRTDEKKRKRSLDSYSFDEDEEDSSEETGTESEPAPPGLEDETGAEEGDTKAKPKKKKTKKKVGPKYSSESSLSKDECEDELEENEKRVETPDDKQGSPETEQIEDNQDNDKNEDGSLNEEEEEKKPEDEVKCKKDEPPKDDGLSKPRPLHKTCSIFLRNLAPTITKQEVEAMCRRYPGFLRVAIADPQPDRRFFRRGWVTFERSVNIKEICWNLNNIRLRDCELGAIVNRDLSRRIRSVNGIASHKQVVRSDIKLAARIIQNLDSQRNLWDEGELKEEPEKPTFGLASKNPLLKNITDYLIEEASAEEEELLGTCGQDERRDQDEGGSTLERDDTLIKVLDRLLLYLRVVHSMDYYNHSEYPSEDEMPNRCGIMHARGSPPSSKVTQQEITEYINSFEQRITPYLQPTVKISDEESAKLGKKDPEAEVEKFVQSNTQELAKDKWLCPLSGKKFKGPEFVRKHIFNKHAEKVDEVRREVEYFNNYLLDIKRPQLPEHPSNRPSGGGNRGEGHGGPYHGGGYPGPPPFGGYGGPRGPGFHGGYGGPGFGGRSGYSEMYRHSGGFKRNYGRGQSDPREVVGYHDLDAPPDLEIF